MKTLFKNRQDAAEQLAGKVLPFKGEEGVVLGIPRGGVPLAKVLAERLNWPLDLIFSKKIPHPIQKEYAIGSVSMTSRIINDAAEVSAAYIDDETHRIRKNIREQYSWYFKLKPIFSYTDKVVMVVDDGMATGYTMLSTLELIAQHKPKSIIVAVPVTSNSAMQLLAESPCKNEVISILSDGSFFSVGQYYDDFGQVSEEEVKSIITTFNQSLA